jgi:hypothetical protein
VQSAAQVIRLLESGTTTAVRRFCSRSLRLRRARSNASRSDPISQRARPANGRAGALLAGTRLELAFEGVPASFAAKLLSVVGLLFVAPLRRQLAANLADVKAEAERRARL